MKFAKVEAEEGIEDLFSSKCKEGTMLSDEKKAIKKSRHPLSSKIIALVAFF